MGKCRALFIGFAVLLLLAAAQGAFAHDYFYQWSGHWLRGSDGTTYQHWDFTQSQWDPIELYNPYGPPEISFTNATYPDPVIGPDGNPNPINTWHIGPGNGGVTITVQNTRIENPVKYIYLQVTSDKAPNNAPTSNPPGSVTSPMPNVQHPYDNWYTYNWLITIQPNPEYETINLVFPESTNISQIVVDTNCVPEPASTLALGAGLVGLLGLRRRKV